MKIGVVSDTHYPETCSRLPDAVFSGLKSADLVLHCGDLTDIAVLDIFRERLPGVEVKAVRGNMDSAKAKNALPVKQILEAGGFKIGLTHGCGHPDDIIDMVNKIFEGERLDAIVFGHTHKPFNKEIGGVLYFNPGSLCDKIFAPYNSYGILEVDKGIKGKIIRIN
ncbi:MAG: metallophosphoesterase family protein [Candidatus Omnitrophica bacterium]|nr:metallophosphoesterase family protein [Candidatus Omnitrophota bacterium]